MAPPVPAAADVLVVGAGIVGAAIAYRLAERGLDVTILEAADAPATGSTGRSAAGVRIQFTSEINVLLSRESIAEYREFEERYGASSGYRPQGYLFLVPEARWPAHRVNVKCCVRGHQAARASSWMPSLNLMPLITSVSSL